MWVNTTRGTVPDFVQETDSKAWNAWPLIHFATTTSGRGTFFVHFMPSSISS